MDFEKIILEKAKENRKTFEEIGNFVFNNPEDGGKEFKSSQYIMNIMKNFGFDVRIPIVNLPTAFVAEYRPAEKVNRTIGFIAEYDALPGFGKDGGFGHACGHNWISATMCGCAITLKHIADEIGCCVRLYGTPAEETFGAKYDMIEAGLFSDLDFAFQAHLDEFTSLETLSLAMNSIEFNFYGKSAHAAQSPEKGINALDAVISMFNNINAMREHVEESTRIHGIITHGGVATNIVPDYAQCKFSMRVKRKSYLKEIRQRIINIAKAAELATGCRLEYRDYENPFDDFINVKSLVNVCKEEMKKVGYTKFIPEEDYPGSGSSDIGNLSYVCPTLYMEIAPEDSTIPVPVHENEAMELVNSKVAYDTMVSVIQAYCNTAVKLCLDDELANNIKKEHMHIVDNK